MNKFNKYKTMKNVLLAIGSIFFITSIFVRVSGTLKNLKNSNSKLQEAEYKVKKQVEFQPKISQMDEKKYYSDFYDVYVKIYDGMININEELQNYAKDIEKITDGNKKAKNILDNRIKELINSKDMVEIKSAKNNIDQGMTKLTNPPEKFLKAYNLLTYFYKDYIEYYESLTKVEGSCDEYAAKIKEIEDRIINLGNKINDLQLNNDS
ncbi:hypothetical protein [Clostridium ganghwense]|uniref:Uncharacterized protein n=1 Tax=Clostridium ganghwense TaxID=312089 RepID=A0ABT4CNZ7_9CLOT|nr:hypothetical protein [Clostridium ganghwense]MCY6370778.1 hypothetical protein [Clostridium ganghwense]